MSEDGLSVSLRYAAVSEAVAEACREAERDPSSVRILPVSKTHPEEMIRELVAIGCTRFGENRVQEMAVKAGRLGAGVSWTLIGHLQRNKVAAACAVMSELQSLDSLELARVLEHEYETTRPDQRLPVLVEVNTSGEPTKNGLAPGAVMDFTRGLATFSHLDPRGLMTVADPDPARADVGFAMMAGLQRQLRDRDGQGWDELSMGMSGDFRSAIAQGSTCVRLGTAIFSQRGTWDPGLR
ncbi:MAG: YggS family pyridoxal phosphate-dependent enzyme [Propionibacteriaceae bacterium]|nr:YggS family pyridoxal phosphate-dependent enzyme [Propionibacteriaceae bacterium]